MFEKGKRDLFSSFDTIMQQEISTIVFDFGGVLVDLSPEVSMREFERLGVSDITTMLNPYHQKGLFRELELGLVTPELFAIRLSEYCHHEISEPEIRKAMLLFLQEIPWYKWQYLAELKKERKVLVLSNTNDFIMDFAHSKEFLPQGIIGDYVDKIYGSNKLHCMKPDREIYQKLMDDASVAPQEILFIDDNQANIDTANSLGWHTLLTTNGEDWRQEVDRILGR